MGIPTYFRFLFQKFGKEIIKRDHNDDCDILFFDFNSLIYKVYYEKEDESDLISRTYSEFMSIVETISPKKQIHIMMDGPCPQAKMKQQRSRRYKAIHLDAKLGKTKSFSPSNHICPGTEFMDRLCTFFKTKLKTKPNFFFSDSNSFGEGEHKIISSIRNMHSSNDKIIVMSPDNDLLSLLLLLGRSDIKLVRYMDMFTKLLLELDQSEEGLIYIIMDTLKDKFKKEQYKLLKDDSLQEDNLLLDYNFLLSMIGNDFVPVLPYMRIKNGGLDKLLQLYRNVLKKKNGEYLICRESYHINVDFFIEIVQGLSTMEEREFRTLASFLCREKITPDTKFDQDESLSPQKILENKINHMYLCNVNHPWYSEYKDSFETLRINRHQSMNEFKSKYYHSFFQLQSNRDDIVREYLQSLQFTLLYYNRGCPSYVWEYPYQACPLFSDVLSYVKKQNDMNSVLTFSMGTMISPFEQLCMILPPQSKDILPKEFHILFQKYKMNYPTQFRLDVSGLKYIYCEADLPPLQYKKSFQHDIRKIERTLSPRDSMRNRIVKKNDLKEKSL